MEHNTDTTNLENTSNSIFKEILQWFYAILIALLVVLLIRGFLFERVYVQGESMNNTLHTGESLVVYKLGYYFSPPKSEDIIVLQYEEGIVKYIPYIDKVPFLKKMLPDPRETDYIKRVIGVPGDIIDLRDGHVYVNGKIKDEPYAIGITYPQSMEFPQTVPENKVFVLGDNRQNSKDSRSIGFVDYSKIKGKATFRVLPFKSFGSIYKNLERD